MYSAANNSACEISLSCSQLVQLIGPTNLLQFDIVKDKIEEKKAEIQRKNSRISYLNSKLKRNAVEKGEILANLTKSHEVCERLEEENIVLRAADKTSSSQVNILTVEKEKLAEALSKYESQIKEILSEIAEIQKKNSSISCLNFKLKRNAVEKGEILAKLAESHKVCERLEEENKTSSSQVGILTLEKEKLAEDLSKCESQIKELLSEKIKLQSANLAQKSYTKFISAQNIKLTSEKEELTESLSQSAKLCEELKEENRRLSTQIQDCQEDNLYLQSESRELSRNPSTICDLCLSVDVKEDPL